MCQKQFYRILNGVDWLSYNRVNERHFGKRIVELAEEESVALDGKELRGSIEYRHANFYSIEEEMFDKRWKTSGFRTLANARTWTIQLARRTEF